MKEEPKKWKIEFSEEAMEQSKDLPDEVYGELSKIIKGLKEGKLDPTKIGQPSDWIDLDKKLKCPECHSENVEWLLDKNSNEVDFHCMECSESFWMSHEEYKITIERNPDKIVDSNLVNQFEKSLDDLKKGKIKRVG